MNDTTIPPLKQNIPFFSYSFIDRRSKTYSKNAGIDGLSFEWEKSLIDIYRGCRKLQVAANAQHSDSLSWLKCDGLPLPIPPKCVADLLSIYLPFYDSGDESKFRFRDKAIAGLGLRRLQKLGPIVTQLFAKPDAAFCKNFWICEWSVEVLLGKDSNGKDKWRDFREIAPKNIPEYYHLANLDQNGKPLRLPEPEPEPEPEPVSKYAVPGPDFDDIDLSDIDGYDRHNNNDF